MSKVYLAVDKDGTEQIHSNYPDKYPQGEYLSLEQVPLPPGTIHKLIGRDLTWEDEPVELTEEIVNAKNYEWIPSDGTAKLKIMPSCRCGGKIVHEMDMNAYPYGDKIEFDRCISCGETYNIKIIKLE